MCPRKLALLYLPSGHAGQQRVTRILGYCCTSSHKKIPTGYSTTSPDSTAYGTPAATQQRR